MSFLISFSDVSLAFGDQKILTNASLQIVDRERVCLIGRNGAGKSSTLKLVTGELEPDEGRIDRPSHVRISKLEQGLDEGTQRQVRDVVGDGMAAQAQRIAQYEALSGAVPLGIDANNAHVQPTGAYHYHGVPTGLLRDLGASPRAGVMLLRGAKARAALASRDYVTPDDIKALFVAALRHRVMLDPAEELEGATADSVLARILESVEVPR